MIPVTIALKQDIAMHGITHARYYGILLTAWYSCIALYHVCSQSKSFRLIPATLALLLALTTAGPWSAFAIANKSQTKRLAKTKDPAERKAIIHHLRITYGKAAYESTAPQANIKEPHNQQNHKAEP